MIKESCIDSAKIFQHAAVILLLVDKNVRVVDINRTGQEIVGKNKWQVLNKLGGEVFNCINAWEDGLPVCGSGANCNKCAIRSRVMNTFDNKIEHYKEEGDLEIIVDEKPVKLSLLISTSLIKEGSEEFVLLTVEDISKIKNSERELLRLNDEKDRFLSILAHDLRSPFNILFGYTELLRENLANYTMTEVETMVKSISRIAENSFGLLNNLLSWANSQSNNLDYNPAKINLSKEINEVLEILKFQAGLKNITLQYSNTDPIYVYADENMLKTILRNLIGNSIKFSYNDSEIDISAVGVNGHVEISVNDIGIGMEESKLNNIWEFSKVESRNGTKGETGTGLGLILCKEFVTKHGGRIWAESKVNEGSKFTFTLPR